MQYRSMLVAAALSASATPAFAHDGNPPHLHINTRWSQCSFQINAALTQKSFNQFTGEAGVVTYFRPLTDARPMGRGKFDLNLVQWKTGIDHHDDAWNDTFVHPDSVHYLFEGSGLNFPGLAARVGITDRTDAGFYFTKSPGANYGFVGGQIQQSLLNNEASNWAASARVSMVSLYGPDDVEFAVYGADFITSRSFAVRKRVTVSPYAIVSGTLSRSHEKSAVVDLKDENVLGAQATLGVAAQIRGAKLGVEYGVARVNSFSIKLGFGR
jgi:hypothetical protein